MGKYFRIIILLSVFVAISSFIFSLSKTGNNEPPVLGGDRDEHGCIGSAGYSWCEPKQKCLRVWEEPCEEPSGDAVGCGVENCHGLDITCGPNPVLMCTEEYLIGDKCRKYVTCGIVQGECTKMEDPQFIKCKSCVEECINKYSADSSMRIFECESLCE